jgi:hypothetical protein
MKLIRNILRNNLLSLIYNFAVPLDPLQLANRIRQLTDRDEQ